MNLINNSSKHSSVVIYQGFSNWNTKFLKHSPPLAFVGYIVKKEIRELGQKLATFDGVNGVRAILPMSDNDHWVEFELQVSRNEQNDVELRCEIWDEIRELVIDYEWKLRDKTGEKWYFGVECFEHFSEISYGSKEMFNSCGQFLKSSSKNWSTNQSNFVKIS